MAKKGHRIANCTEKLCSLCNRREHTAEVCPTSKEQAVLAVTSEVGTRVDVVRMVRPRLQLSSPKVQASSVIVFSGMGDRKLAWQVGD